MPNRPTMAFDSGRAAQELAREHEALANMQGADSARVDNLVKDVGQIKGDIGTLKADMGRVGTGIDQLQQSMAVLSRHAVLMETQASDIATLGRETGALDQRLRAVEVVMPQLQEVRGDIRKGMIFVVAGVAAAVLALVIKRP